MSCQLNSHSASIPLYRSAIDSFIDDNKKLMRRMYGSLIQEELEVVENVQG